MHNADSLTTILQINKTNVQLAIIMEKKFILLVIINLKHKIIVFPDLPSPSLNRNHHCITNFRRQDDHQVLVAHLSHNGVTITISVFWITGMHPHYHSLR